MMARAASSPDSDHVLAPSGPTVREHPVISKAIAITIQNFMVILLYRISSQTYERRDR